ncbi:MAG TPA: type II secretion system F family protein [Acidimicrobiia bacterium]|nr:type II secretion system F family protein [Acidimicrobiia bacterium]
MRRVLGGSIGLMVAGPLGALAGLLVAPSFDRARRREDADPSTSLVLLLLLIELRSGMSVLAALHGVSSVLPGYDNLRIVARVASVAGLIAAIAHANDELRPVVAQLARAQRSGASLGGTVRRMLDEDLAEDRARRIARARALPVRLMMPVTLLILPGMVLMLYAPSILDMFEELTGSLL